MTDDKNLQAVASKLQVRDSLVLIEMVEKQFLLAGDILSLVPIKQMQPATHEYACGSLLYEGELVPVFQFNRNLQLQSVADSRCLVLAMLSSGTQRFALTCLNIEKLSEVMPVFYPVPRCMSSRKQPFGEFAVINQKAVGLTSGAELLGVLRLRGASLLNQQPIQHQSAIQ